MTKVEELKALYEEMQQEIEDKYPNSDPPADAVKDLEYAINAYKDAVAEAEMEAKSKQNEGETKMNIMDKHQFNDSLKKFLLGDKTVFDAAAGNNGAVGPDGGYLIPTELQPLFEVGVGGTTLAPICSVYNVGSRTGSIPVVD